MYYLLTGQPPFAGDDVVQIVADVLERDAESPRRLKPDVPDALAQIVLRCLAKEPAQRPDSYQRLRRDLLPFSSQALTPATPGVRVTAAILDYLISGLPLLFLLFLNVADRSRTRVAGTRDRGLRLPVCSTLVCSRASGALRSARCCSRFELPDQITVRPESAGSLFARWSICPRHCLPLAILLTVPLFARTMAGATTASRCHRRGGPAHRARPPVFDSATRQRIRWPARPGESHAGRASPRLTGA